MIEFFLSILMFSFLKEITCNEWSMLSPSVYHFGHSNWFFLSHYLLISLSHSSLLHSTLLQFSLLQFEFSSLIVIMSYDDDDERTDHNIIQFNSDLSCDNLSDNLRSRSWSRRDEA